MLRGENVGVIFSRTVTGAYDWSDIQVTKNIVEFGIMATRVGNGAPIAPLYLYPDGNSLDSSRVPNLDMSIVKQIEKSLGLEFVAEPQPADKSAPLSRGEYSLKTNVGVVPCADPIRGQPQGIAPTIKPNGHTREGGYLTDTSDNIGDSRLHGNDGDINSPSDMKGWQSQTDGVVLKNFSPIDLLDYIYAVLHSPNYRERYKEFLKIDFPRVPYPTIDTFWQLVELGSQLRQIHLLESPVVTNYITSYPIDGDNIVDKPSYKDGKVYINKEQYFDNVPEDAWNFYIGGYQPAQKWLKDRKGRELGFEDILHYQKIIVALTETDRLMREIDKIEF